jgi:hypothetical protein
MVKVLKDPSATDVSKKTAINTAMQVALDKRTRMLSRAKVEGHELDIAPVEITKTDTQAEQRTTQDAATSILSQATLKIGAAGKTLKAFIKASKKKLNALFSKSTTLGEFVDTQAYAEWLKTATPQDVRAYQYMLTLSRKVNEFF